MNGYDDPKDLSYLTIIVRAENGIDDTNRLEFNKRVAINRELDGNKQNVEITLRRFVDGLLYMIDHNKHGFLEKICNKIIKGVY